MINKSIELVRKLRYKAHYLLDDLLRLGPGCYLLKRKMKRATPIFIFQMAKVASTSIHYSLKRCYPGAVVHGHFIGKDNWQTLCLYNWSKSGGKIKIISPIREPVGRNLSAFFSRLKYYTGASNDRPDLSNEELKELFLKNLDHTAPLNWFDNNIREFFGIDVYKKPFPESGYTTYCNNNVELLVMKFDLSDDIKQSLIADFLDFPEFKLETHNVSRNKPYYQTYKDFCENTKLPESYLTEMYQSKYVQHFFTADEIAKATSRWT